MCVWGVCVHGMSEDILQELFFLSARWVLEPECRSSDLMIRHLYPPNHYNCLPSWFLNYIYLVICLFIVYVVLELQCLLRKPEVRLQKFFLSYCVGPRD